MIDARNGRYCIVCSYKAHARNNDLLAIEGLPALSATQGKPLTDHLCEGHIVLFSWAPQFVGMCDDNGTPDTYLNGVPQETFLKMVRRPQHFAIGTFSQDDALTGLQYMEHRLYVLRLELEAKRHIWSHPGGTDEPEILTADEAVDHAGWRRWIRDALPTFLERERLRSPDDDGSGTTNANTPNPNTEPFPYGMTLMDWPDDSDRISGEE